MRALWLIAEAMEALVGRWRRLATGISIASVLLPRIALSQTPYHAPPASMTCPSDKIVWINTRSHIYHFPGQRYFGSTQEGKFLCKHDADIEGDRPTHNGQ